MKISLIKTLKKVFLFLSTGIVIGISSCSDNKLTGDNTDPPVTPDQKAKYIFFLIGDGMAAPQINVAEAALNEPDFKAAYEAQSLATSRTRAVGLGKLNLRDFPVAGMANTHAEDRYITCSAAAATALATGYKTTINTIGMNGDRSQNLKTMAEMAKEKGMKVGIVSSVSIDHATPACFYAHTEDRNNYEEIGNQLLTSGFDYFGGGTVRWNKRTTLKTAAEYKAAAAEQDYSFVDTKAEFNALNNNSGKVIATLNLIGTGGYTGDSSAMPYVIDWKNQKDEDKISLADFTAKGIELLDNENGFFMMVESGKIDWACHANDVVSSVYDMIAFDEAIGVALDFYKEHPDETLIIITGDHECGGLTLGFAATDYETAFDLLKVQSVSFQEFSDKVISWSKQENQPTFDEAFAQVTAAFGLVNEYTDEEKTPDYLNPTHELSDYELGLLKQSFTASMKGKGAANILPEELTLYYGVYDPFTVTITHILNNKAGIDWTTYAHTGVPVPVFAIGACQELFNGYYDNTDVAKKIMKAGQLEEKE